MHREGFQPSRDCTHRVVSPVPESTEVSRVVTLPLARGRLPKRSAAQCCQSSWGDSAYPEIPSGSKSDYTGAGRAVEVPPEVNRMRHFAFKSYTDLTVDVRGWLDTLPRHFDVIVGIPRSGLLVASLISLSRNLPMTDVEGLISGRLFGNGRQFEGAGACLLSEPRRVLVVDDSVLTGRQLGAVRSGLERASLPHEISYGCVYVDTGREDLVDHFYEVVPYPRMFEWNFMQHQALESCYMDIDGVLCRDPTEEENDDGEHYVEFLSSVDVRERPAFRVGALVTSRLERYRPQTEAWLRWHGIRYDSLIMMPYATKAERIAAGHHAAFKAEAYQKSRAMVFIESDAVQAQEIADITARPVICTDQMRLCVPRIASKADVIAGLRRARTPARQLRWLRGHRRPLVYWMRRRFASRGRRLRLPRAVIATAPRTAHVQERSASKSRDR